MSYKSTEMFATAVKAMLDQRAAEDELFAISYANEKKTIEECCTFIIGEVHKMGVNAMSSEDVLSLAVHYYDEDNISVGARVSCKVIVPTTPEIDEMRKAELREQAERKYYDDCLAEVKKNKAKVTKPAQRTPPVESLQTLF